MRGEDSAGGASDLALYEDTLDAPAYQDIVGELAAAGRERVVRRRKGRVGTATPPLHLLPRNFTHRFGPDKVVSWVASFELFKLVFVTEHHVSPILLYAAPGELQPTALVSFRQS